MINTKDELLRKVIQFYGEKPWRVPPRIGTENWVWSGFADFQFGWVS